MPTSRFLDPAHAWNVLLASDPTLDRLRTGLRAVGGAALSAWALSTLGRAAGVPPTVWLLGVNFAMASALFVQEGSLRAERRASLVVPLLATAGLALAAAAGSAPAPLPAVVALAVIFAAVWARRLGPLGVGGGMAAFLTFFVAQYFRVRVAQLPAGAAAIAIGAAIASVLRFGLVRQHPERTAARTLGGLRRTVVAVLRRLEDDLLARPGRRLARRLSREIDRLHEAALSADDVLVRLPVAALPSGIPLAVVRERVFEVQLAAERVVQAVGQVAASGALPAASRRAARGALETAREAADGRGPGSRGVERHLARAAELAAADGARGAAGDDLRRLRVSLRDLAVAARQLRPSIREAPSLPAPAPPAAPPDEARGPLGLRASTRQALQATVASALAMAAGQRLSSMRWFWAVIAAFVVFTRATTVADTVQRAWLRILGTVVGAAAGILLGAAVAGHPRVMIAVVFSCIFLAYWLFRLSYAWFLFWFTTLIAVLYRLLGQYSPELMVLRIEETLLGAGLGAAVAALVLPIHARTRIREGVAEVLRVTAAWLDEAVVARAAEGGEASIAASRAMEGRLRALRATAQPLMGSAIRAPRSARFVHGATAVVLYARHLAPGEALRMLDPPLRGEVAEAGRLVAASARRTAALLAGEEPGAEPSPAASVALRRIRASLRGAAATPHGPATPPVWLGWLERLDEALQDLAAAAEEGRGGGRDARVAGAIADASASRTAPSSA